MKRKFLLGVFLLTVLLTSLGTQLVANASIYGIRMVDVHGDTFINDNRFYSGSTRNENPTINVEQGTSVQFYFLVEGERSNSLTFEPYYLVHLPANRDEAIKKVISIRDNLTCNLQDGPAQEIRNGNWFRIRDDIHAIPDFTRKNPEAEEYAKFTINVSENAEVGMTYDFELCAFPCVGYQEGISDQKDMNQKFTINVVKAPEKPKFEKTSPFSITLYQGAIGTFDTDCENLSRCYVDTTPESLDKAGLDYIRTEYDPLPGSMVWPGDKPEHSITFKAKANTKPLYDSDHPSATSKESEWTVHAVSPQGGVRTATLKVTVNATEKTSSAAMTANSITLMQGETKDVKLIGNNIVKNWHYNNNDLSPDIYISLSPDQNPTTCTAHVKVNPDAKTGTHTADIHVFNEEGYAGANPGKLTITVTPNEDHMKPIIDNPEEEVTVLQGGVSTVTFTGKYAKSWLSSRYGSEYFTSKLSTKLDFSKNPNRCDFQVIADETSPIGTYDLYLYAINAAGQRSERAKLTVHVVENEAHTPATIDTNETVSVVLGQRARATFTGKHVRSWTVDNSDVDKYAWIDDIECSYAVNPDRCDMTVITNTGVNADVSEAKIKVYAYNAVGKKSDPATLTIVAAKPDDYKDPVIDTSESVSVIAGGTAKAVFTGQHIRRWGYNMNFSDDIHGIELNYSTNPNRCEVLVTADAKAKAGTYTVTIYAYNEVGEETSATLTVKITTEETKYEDPVIDENEEVSVIAGGTAKAVFTGQHIRAWKHGNLPDAVKAVELNYSVNPNRCEALVTASSTATAGTYTVTIYAYNEVGEETSATLTVKITEEATKYELPTIDENEEVSVIAGGTAKAVFTGQHIRAWKHGNLPDAVKAVELNYSVNPNRCEALVTASSTATAGTYTVTIYAYNEVGEETSATLTVKITEEATKYELPTIDENEEVSVIAGGTAKAVFTGQHIRAWKHGNLPDAVKAVELNYSVNPNRCEALVTASSTATAGTYTVTIYAYNEVGEETSATLTVKITTEETKYEDPVIDENEEVSVIAGGTAKAVFTGQHIRAWKHGNLPDAVKAVELNYSVNPNRCEALVTASSTATAGTYTVTIYAYNEVGEETSATLTVKITTEETKYEDPVIDENEEVSVIAGGTAKAVFTGQHIRAWKHGNLPDAVKAVELNYSVNPNRCEALVTASSTATAGTYTVTIYAYNEVGEETSATLTVKITTEETKYEDPVIDENEEVSVIAGGTAKAVFTGQHIRAWKHGNLPDAVKAVELNYSVNPNRCEALVTASSTATAGTYTVTIYAYNEIGEETSTTLTVKITTEETKYAAPTIDEGKTVSVIAGGTAKAVFTGTNVKSWKYGNLPDAVKAVELDYTKNSNVCNVLVTAGSNATAGTYKVTMYAYNEIGSETSADLTVTVTIEPKVEKAVISTTAASVSVVAGGTAQVKLSGTNVRAWIYWNLPDAIKAVELDYGSDPNICEVFVTAGSNAEAGEVSFDVYAYNEVGEEAATPATITVTITASGSDTDTKPKLTTAPTSVELVPDGKTTLTFMGENISFWKYEDSSYLLAEVDLNYSANANVCYVKLTANDFVVEGLSDDIRIVAYNANGESVSSDLVINIIKDTSVPTINVPSEKDQFKSVVPGGTVKAVISGDADITTWSYKKGTSSVVEKVKLDNTTTPSLNICNVIITVSSTAAVSSVNTSAAGEWLNIYAYNSKGNRNKYPMPISINVVAPTADKAPTIASGQSVTITPGESASATFTGTKVVDWEIPTLAELATTDFTSITQNYDRDGNPNSNTVTVSAASAAASGEHTVTVYAYGEDGQSASADLKVTVTGSSSKSSFVGSSGGGCDMGFAGLGVGILSLMFAFYPKFLIRKIKN